MGDTLGDMLNGFKEFIMKGNVIDLAVAVIIGSAFGAVVNALVNSVLMPFIAGLVGSPNFDSFLLWNFNGNEVAFGVLLTAIVNFLLIASAIYFVVVTPIAVIFRRGKDPLRLRFEPQADSYWLPRQPPGPAPETMVNQY